MSDIEHAESRLTADELSRLNSVTALEAFARSRTRAVERTRAAEMVRKQAEHYDAIGDSKAKQLKAQEQKNTFWAIAVELKGLADSIESGEGR